MAFVNEYISEEDRSKYKIDERFLKRNPQHKTVPEYWEPHWSRDGARNLYLMKAGGTNQAITEDVVFYFDFFVNGESFVYILRHGPGRSSKFTEDPFIVSWTLVDVKPPVGNKNSIKEVTLLFKEALTSYGLDGKNKYVKRTVVKFDF